MGTSQHAAPHRPSSAAVSHTQVLPCDVGAARHLAGLLEPVFGGAAGTPAGPPVVVVDIGANPLDDEAPYQLLLESGLCRVIGFEPQPDALAELRRRAGPHETYLPHAVGDGARHTLRLCAGSGFASLLEPDPRQLELLIDFPRLAAVTGTEEIATVRLDDLAEVDRVDLLKIDIQGGERDVLASGRSTLAGAVAVQTEVGFHRLYRDQPTFADVDLELRAQGFVPQQFVSTRTWPLAPVVWADPLEQVSRQLVEADVLYVRDLARPDLMDDLALARSALVADVVYGNAGVALRCLRTLIERGALHSEVETRYRAAATARLG